MWTLEWDENTKDDWNSVIYILYDLMQDEMGWGDHVWSSGHGAGSVAWLDQTPQHWNTTQWMESNIGLIIHNWLVVWNMAVIFPNSWDNVPIWLIFIRGVETTNQHKVNGLKTLRTFVNSVEQKATPENTTLFIAYHLSMSTRNMLTRLQCCWKITLI